MQDLTENLDVAITNLEVSHLKALKFHEKKIVEVNIDHENVQVKYIPNNDGTNACFLLSLDLIN